MAKIEIITPDHGGSFGTRILVDGVEQEYITEATLHIKVDAPVTLELKRYAMMQGIINGEAAVNSVVICPHCTKALHGE